MHETTALGAAIAAGFASGIWSTYEELRHMNRANRAVFRPYLDVQESSLMYKQWSKAVEMCRGWLDASEIGMEEDDDEDDEDEEEGESEGEEVGRVGGPSIVLSPAEHSSVSRAVSEMAIIEDSDDEVAISSGSE
jgi:glycerol kinase